jgi:hypothetical protein
MKPREKRTTTEPGLGQAPGDARRTAIRERLSEAALRRQGVSEAPPSAPISAPPASAPPMSSRHTRALEGAASSSPPARSEPPANKTSDTRALADAYRPTERHIERRTPTMREEPNDEDVRPAERRPLPQRSIEGRPHQAPSRAPEPRPVSSKPPRRPTNRPPAPVAPVTEPPRSGRPAKSARASIRIDDVGAAAVKTDAVSVAGRQVPKIVRTKTEIAEAPIDHRAGFLLAHIDGVTSVQGLVDIAGMPENEVHEILDRLRRLGIVTIR